jgi:hypothetical protein
LKKTTFFKWDWHFGGSQHDELETNVSSSEWFRAQKGNSADNISFSMPAAITWDRANPEMKARADYWITRRCPGELPDLQCALFEMLLLKALMSRAGNP